MCRAYFLHFCNMRRRCVCAGRIRHRRRIFLWRKTLNTACRMQTTRRLKRVSRPLLTQHDRRARRARHSRSVRHGLTCARNADLPWVPRTSLPRAHSTRLSCGIYMRCTRVTSENLPGHGRAVTPAGSRMTLIAVSRVYRRAFYSTISGAATRHSAHFAHRHQRVPRCCCRGGYAYGAHRGAESRTTACGGRTVFPVSRLDARPTHAHACLPAGTYCRFRMPLCFLASGSTGGVAAWMQPAAAAADPFRRSYRAAFRRAVSDVLPVVGACSQQRLQKHASLFYAYSSSYSLPRPISASTDGVVAMCCGNRRFPVPTVRSAVFACVP
jgi:hypothetical protein